MRFLTTVITVSLLMIPFAAIAETPGDMGAFHGPPPGMMLAQADGPPLWTGMDRDSPRARLMIMYRMIDDLEIDEDTATKFFPIYNEFTKTRDELGDEHRSLARSIATRAGDESVPVEDLMSEVKKLQDNEEKMADLKREFYAEARKILNDRQYVKLVVFDDKLKYEIIRELRMRHRQERERDDNKNESWRSRGDDRG